MTAAQPLVAVTGVHVHFPIRGGLLGRRRGVVRAVDDVSLVIRRHETFGLVGESGSGKSTLARAILGLVAPTGGEVYYDGRPTTRLPDPVRRRLRRRMQIIFQDPYASLDPRQRVADAIAEPMLLHGVCRTKTGAARRAADLLTLVGLGADVLPARPRHLSGGQRQRVVIARALALGPEFLILDEPTSFLDVSVQARVLQLLKDLQRQLHLTYLFISHNLDVVAYMSDRIGVMYRGRLVELSTVAEVFERPLHPYTEVLVNSVLPPDPDAARRRQAPRLAARGETGGCRYYPVCPKGQPRCTLVEPALLQTHPQHDVACYVVDGYEEVMARGSRSREGVAGSDSAGAGVRAPDARSPGQR